ncbi:MAG: hypothetical protein Q9180_007580, partial [Flavoplaca navasiana]
WAWEQWMLKLQVEMGKENLLEGIAGVMEEGKATGAGWRCLNGLPSPTPLHNKHWKGAEVSAKPLEKRCLGIKYVVPNLAISVMSCNNNNVPIVMYRALIKTHHMTSQKKIQAITKSAKQHSCSVFLKTGKPPGVMIAEGTEDAVKQWVEGVKVGSTRSSIPFSKRINFYTRSVRAQTQMKQRLRYKDYRLLRLEAVTMGQLATTRGYVTEFGAMKDLSAHLEECEVWEWWAEHMGFTNGGR